MKLPTVQGTNLARQACTFPQDFAAEFNLVFVAFQQWQQQDVDTWGPFAEHLRQTNESFEYYEFPTIQKMNFFARTFIKEGMRAGIPNKATRNRTITLYIDKEPFRQALNIPTEDQISVFLFNRQGEVLWQARGSTTPAKGEGLKTAVTNR